MADLQILLTDSSGDTFNLSQDDIVSVVVSGTGSKIMYSNDGLGLKEVIVTEAVTDVAGMSNQLFLATPADGAATSYINSNRLLTVVTANPGVATVQATATITITDFTKLNTGDKVNLIATDGTNYDFVNGAQSSVNGTWESTTSNDATATNLMNVINTSSGPAGTRFNATVDGAVVTAIQATAGIDGNTTVTLTDPLDGMDSTNFVGGVWPANISYSVDGSSPRELIVDESPSSVSTDAGNLVEVTPSIGTEKLYLNSANIELIDDEGTGSVIMYNQEGASLHEYVVDETKGAINIQVYENAGKTVYTVDAVTPGTPSITLITGDGDVTAVFVAGKVLSVVDSTGNDGTYTTASSAYGGGKTTITINETPPDSTGDGSVLTL